jgi:hypothetical protein
MAEESVDELIRQLETLRIQEDTLLRQIIQARARESQQGQGTDGAGQQRDSQILHRGPRSNHEPNARPHR